eukprot:GHVT01009677.1.p1 GENE.GHVT01009677.1~~GHVT01009677.1.p1  ORF type:complete len:165 (+),score=29.45 GHVT01009677.1:238-732(+)
MTFSWSQRPYCAPSVQSLEGSLRASPPAGSFRLSSVPAPASFSARGSAAEPFVPLRIRVGTLGAPSNYSSSPSGGLPASGASGGRAAGAHDFPLSTSLSGNLATLSTSFVPSQSGGLLQCWKGGDEFFFLPKPSNLIKFALPTLVFLPNITVFSRAWLLFAPGK